VCRSILERRSERVETKDAKYRQRSACVFCDGVLETKVGDECF
jgi:hypothetical protein